ncbi:response regulator transcription factor [Paractinoplanes lichenicola]|uniref:Response regulator transcription factor n=1 Tax=Paractinoplanes lichenicola TaxID=2802976 RepID=A0ABS1W0K2_9ACTN|nr:response regulator transcription factor [Actinoplanes lichenicola]MBL7260218.1 response regulator transcription factor [Actinoplanes lichenicola]
MRLPVLLVDDHRVLVDSLALSLELQPDLCCAAVAYTARDGLAKAAAIPYAVAVVDLQLPDAGGLDVVARLRAMRPDAPIVVLTAHPKADLADRALAAGAAAFLGKDLPLTEILTVIRSADPARPQVVAGLRQPPVGLTHRELDVLRELGQGHDATRAAATLGISLHTARGHIKAVLAKLGVQTQLDAVVSAERLGLITVGSRY